MKNENIKSRFNKKNILSSTIFSAAFCFTIFFFSPIDIYLANQIDFIVGYDIIIFPMFGVSILSTLLLIGFFMLCLLINEIFFNIVKNLLFGVFCAMYIQMLFYNGRVKSFTDQGSLNLENQDVYVYTNYLLYWLIICIPIIIWCVKESYPNLKPFNKISQKTLPFLSLSMAVMQLVGTVSLVFDYGINFESKDDYKSVLSIDEAMKLSPKENIVVFLTDRMDGIWMDEELEKYPDLKEVLDGFTFYQNNVSCYTNTFPSVAQMITGKKYDGHQWNREYLNNAWSGQNVVNILRDNNYRVNLLIDGTTTYNSSRLLKNNSDNLKQADNNIRINYTGKDGVISTMTIFSLIKLFPYYIKGILSEEIHSDFANRFLEIDYESYGCFPFVVGSDSDLLFYNYLTKNGINTESEKKTFSFIHLHFAHSASSEFVNLNPHYENDENDDFYSSLRGSFEILNEYFKQMKKLGIYDSSTIIVVGDHGCPPYVTQDGKDRLNNAIVTTLMIKEANAEHAPLKIDNNAEMSNLFFSASILEYAGLDHFNYGLSYNDVISANLSPERILNVYNLSDNQPTIVCQYSITGDARNFDNWQYIKPN